MSELIGDLIYRPNADVIQNRQPSTQRKGIYELDKLSVTYDGAPTRIASFVAGISRGDTLTYKNGDGDDVTLTTMFFNGPASLNDDPALRQLSLPFIGFIDGVESPPEIDDTLVSSNVSTTVTITDPSSPLYTEDGSSNPATKLNGTIEYYEASTMIKWFALEQPDENIPLYNTASNNTPPLDRPYILRINSSNQGGSPSTIDLSDVIALFNTLTAQMHVVDYRPKALIPGKLWQCTACIRYALVGAS